MITSYRTARRLAGLTVEQLARKATLNAKAIRAIEDKSKAATPRQRAKIMNACLAHGVVFVAVDSGHSVSWFKPVKLDALKALDGARAKASARKRYGPRRG